MMDEKVHAFAEKKGIEVHFLPDDDPDYEGPAALCDVKAGLDEAPRVTTLAVSDPETVTCPACKEHLEGVSVARMSKSQKIMELVHTEGGDTVLFGQEDTEVQFYMSREDFEDFGEPSTITLTVEPGDMLNTDNEMHYPEEESDG